MVGSLLAAVESPLDDAVDDAVEEEPADAPGSSLSPSPQPPMTDAAASASAPTRAARIGRTEAAVAGSAVGTGARRIDANTSFAGVSRLFVAVWPPPAVVDLLHGLPRADGPRLRWTTPDQWHITLRFLGDVDEDAAVDLLAAVDGRRCAVELGPAVTRLGTDLVVAPVRGLDALAAAVWAVHPGLGAAPHADGFRGHLTVARQRGGGTTAADDASIAASFLVDEIALVRSELLPEGARYTTVTRRRLPA